MSNDPYHAGTADELPSIEEQLVAYLDGELDDESSRSLEQRLATDSTLRLQLGRLERTWDLLDQLGRAEVGETFTRTTIEMVALAAEQEQRQEEAERPIRRRRRLLGAAAGILASSAAGFVLVWALWPNPNRQLLEDLPVLESLDEYQQIDGIEFLELLHEKGVFAEEGNNDGV